MICEVVSAPGGSLAFLSHRKNTSMSLSKTLFNYSGNKFTLRPGGASVPPFAPHSIWRTESLAKPVIRSFYAFYLLDKGDAAEIILALLLLSAGGEIQCARSTGSIKLVNL